MTQHIGLRETISFTLIIGSLFQRLGLKLEKCGEMVGFMLKALTIHWKEAWNSKNGN
jgi:hypothetical protein